MGASICLMTTVFNSIDGSPLHGGTISRLGVRNLCPRNVLVLVNATGGINGYRWNRAIAEQHLLLWNAFIAEHPSIHVVFAHVAFTLGSSQWIDVWPQGVPFPKQITQKRVNNLPSDEETDYLYERFVPRQRLLVEKQLNVFIGDLQPWLREFQTRLGMPAMDFHTMNEEPSHWLLEIIRDW